MFSWLGLQAGNNLFIIITWALLENAFYYGLSDIYCILLIDSENVI